VALPPLQQASCLWHRISPASHRCRGPRARLPADLGKPQQHAWLVTLKRQHVGSGPLPEPKTSGTAAPPRAHRPGSRRHHHVGGGSRIEHGSRAPGGRSALREPTGSSHSRLPGGSGAALGRACYPAAMRMPQRGDGKQKRPWGIPCGGRSLRVGRMKVYPAGSPQRRARIRAGRSGGRRGWQLTLMGERTQAGDGEERERGCLP